MLGHNFFYGRVKVPHHRNIAILESNNLLNSCILLYDVKNYEREKGCMAA